MVFKIHKIKIFPKFTLTNKGFTFVEVMVSFTLFLILVSYVMYKISPGEIRSRARDEKRLSDITTLDRAINEYKLDFNAYPDSITTTRQSNLLPSSNSGPFESAVSGWIVGDFGNYGRTLPIDPINDDIYFYSYRHDGLNYEVNTTLEYYFDEAQEDGGNSDVQYELGTDLTIL